VVVEIDPARFTAVTIPTEDKPPLLVHTYRMKLPKLSMQFLEMIAWRRSQILVGCRVVDHLQPTEKPVLKVWRNFSRSDIVLEEGAQPFVPKIDAHRQPRRNVD
jgi:hypothetical protein